jgi:nucleoside-diphosphate-sugar epimerase
MSVALITGGLGFIGSFIARRLLAEGLVDRVVLLDHYGIYVDITRAEFYDYRRLRVRGIEDRLVVERGEAKYFSVVHQVLDRHRPRYIFHLAALPLSNVQNLTTQEAEEGNVTSTSNLLEAVAQIAARSDYRPERFVYASSSMVYGDFQYSPADEEHPTRPANIYGTAKLAGEVMTRGLSRFYGIDCAIVRPSAVYGPTDMNRRVSQVFLESAMRGEKVVIQGACETLDFTYVKDAAAGFVLAATRREAIGETFNIAAGRGRTLVELMEVLKEHFPDASYEVKERDASRPRRGSLSIEKARQKLGYEPAYDLAAGVSEYIGFIRENHPELRA